MKEQKSTDGYFEYSFLVTLTMAMLAFGIVMVFSASWSSLRNEQQSYYYLKRELLYGSLGMVLMFTLARNSYMRLLKLAPMLMVLSIGLLLVVLIPWFGADVNGASRLISIGPFIFQPAELAKIAIVLYVAMMINKQPRLVRDLKSMALQLLVLPALACIFILLEPDVGTFVTIMLTLLGMLLIERISTKELAIIARPIVVAFGTKIFYAVVALGAGGLFGIGLGESIQNLNDLPAVQTDKILLIIGEEMGLVGVLVIAIGYACLVYLGFRIALCCSNLFGKYVTYGVTFVLISQAIANFFVATGFLPLTGTPLPLISYSGSNMVVTLASIGIMLNIAVTECAASDQEAKEQKQ